MLDDKYDGGVYAPAYYGDFKCIAGRCRHNCCIDWEICIDSATHAKYEKIGKSITDTIEICDDGFYFKLTENGRCPHLNSSGLCEIIISHGEGCLSEICKNHPRFFNDTANGRRECGLGIVCEEACRLILQNEEPFTLSKIGKAREPRTRGDFDPIPERDRIITLAESADGSFRNKLELLKMKYGIPNIYTKNEWIRRLLKLEILDAAWEKNLQTAYSAPECKAPTTYDKYYERLFTYFAFRHISIAESPEDLRARLGFAILSTEMIKLLFERSGDQKIDTLADIARRYSAEIEYSEDNTAELIFEFECAI